MNRYPGLEIGWRAAALRKQPDLICPICGRDFHRRGKRKTQGKHAPCCSVRCKAFRQKGVPFTKMVKRGAWINCLICGKGFYRYPCQRRLHCSMKCRDKNPETCANFRGEKHYNWKGGLSPINQALRSSPAARKWTMEVFRRDKFTCRSCGKKRTLQSHHIYPWAEFHSLRFRASNGITLCKLCHSKLHFLGRHYSIINPHDIDLWQQLSQM